MGNNNSKKTLRLLLIGKTGGGKSATGNSILRHTKFESKNTMESVTTVVDMATCVVDGVTVIVVDGPGLGDAKLSKEKMTIEAIKYIESALKQCTQGFDGILYVANITDRFTADVKQHLCTLQDILGKNALSDFGIFLLTRVDKFDEDEEGMEVNHWCKQQSGVFREILQNCRGRMVLFNNKTKDASVRKKQFDELLRQMSGCRQDTRYSMQHYNAAASSRDEALLKAKADAMKTDVADKCSKLWKKVKDAERKTPEEIISVLSQVKREASDLKERVSREDKGTGVLVESLNILEQLLASAQRVCCDQEMEIERRRQMKEAVIFQGVQLVARGILWWLQR